MDHPHDDVRFLARKARQVGLRANDGERALVDRARRREDSRAAQAPAASPRINRAICPRSRRDSTSAALSSGARMSPHSVRKSRDSASGSASGLRIASRLVASGAVHHHAAAAFDADDRQRHGARTGATLGAARNVHHRGAPTIAAPAARLGASARDGISAAAQIGAPAQATIRRRGSSRATIKPSRCRPVGQTPCGVLCDARQRGAHGLARYGTPVAPTSAAARASSSSVVESACPKARPKPTATPTVPQRMLAHGVGRRPRRRRYALDGECAIARPNGAAPSAATMSLRACRLPARSDHAEQHSARRRVRARRRRRRWALRSRHLRRRRGQCPRDHSMPVPAAVRRPQPRRGASAPPPSITTETFGARSSAKGAAAMARRRSAAIALGIEHLVGVETRERIAQHRRIFGKCHIDAHRPMPRSACAETLASSPRI